MASTYIPGKGIRLKNPSGDGRLPLTSPGYGPFGTPCWARVGAAPVAVAGRNSAVFSHQKPLVAVGLEYSNGGNWRNEPVSAQAIDWSSGSPHPKVHNEQNAETYTPAPTLSFTPPGNDSPRKRRPPPLAYSPGRLRPLPVVQTYTPVATPIIPNLSFSSPGRDRSGSCMSKSSVSSGRLAASSLAMHNGVQGKRAPVSNSSFGNKSSRSVSTNVSGRAPPPSAQYDSWDPHAVEDFLEHETTVPLAEPALGTLLGGSFGARLRNVFDGIDAVCEGDDRILKEELLRILRRPGDRVGALALYRELDANFDGEISPEEWHSFFEGLLIDKGPEKVENILSWLEEGLGYEIAAAPLPEVPFMRGQGRPQNRVLRSRSLREQSPPRGLTLTSAGSWLSCVDPFQVGDRAPPGTNPSTHNSDGISTSDTAAALRLPPSRRGTSRARRSSFKTTPLKGSDRGHVSFDESSRASRASGKLSQEERRNPFHAPLHEPFSSVSGENEEELLNNLDILYEESFYVQSMADGSSFCDTQVQAEDEISELLRTPLTPYTPKQPPHIMRSI